MRFGDGPMKGMRRGGPESGVSLFQKGVMNSQRAEMEISRLGEMIACLCQRWMQKFKGQNIRRCAGRRIAGATPDIDSLNGCISGSRMACGTRQ